MKLHQDNDPKLKLVTGYGTDHVMINRERHDQNLVLLPDRIVEPWGTAGFEQLSEADFAALTELGATVILIGTGGRQRFPNPRLLRPLMAARIGYEVMDLAAACRTYNILADEGRSVAAALLFDRDA